MVQLAGCSRGRVWKMLNVLPSRILTAIITDVCVPTLRINIYTFSKNLGLAQWAQFVLKIQAVIAPSKRVYTLPSTTDRQLKRMEHVRHHIFWWQRSPPHKNNVWWRYWQSLTNALVSNDGIQNTATNTYSYSLDRLRTPRYPRQCWLGLVIRWLALYKNDRRAIAQSTSLEVSKHN